MSWIESLKEQMKKKVKNPKEVLKILLKREFRDFQDLDDSEFIYLKKVLEKLASTSVDKKELDQVTSRLAEVETRGGKRKLRFSSRRNPEMIFFTILRRASEENYETLHIKSDAKPLVRQGDELKELSAESTYDESDILDLLAEVLNPEAFARFQKEKHASSSLSIPGLSRFKLSAFYECRKPGICFRQVPQFIPDPQEIDLYPGYLGLTTPPKGGLVLICGPAISGKSTTCASLVEEWNKTRACRVLTLEDPIEYLFSDKKASIVQRELHSDLPTKEEGMHHALVDGADVFFLSSIDSLEDLDWALNLAESGVLVLSTVQTETCQTALETLSGLIESQSARLTYLNRLSHVLEVMTCQVLVPTKTGGRFPVREILKMDPGARNLIRENNLVALQSYMHQSLEGGTVSFHRQFMRLLEEGLFDLDSIIDWVPDHQTFLSRIQGHRSIG